MAPLAKNPYSKKIERAGKSRKTFFYKTLLIEKFFALNNLNQGEFHLPDNNLRQEFELLTQALDASISGIIITDNQQADNPIIYCNHAFEQISGYQRSEIIGHNCRFLQKEDRNQAALEKIRAAISGGERCVVELRNYRKDGTLFWNELYMSPVIGEGGRVNYFIGVQNDITRRKVAEQQVQSNQADMERRIEERTRSLKENQEYLSSIVQTVRESLIVLQPDLKVMMVNDHFMRTFKVSREETEGRQLYDLGNGQWDIPELRKLLEQILPTNNPVIDFEVSHDFPYIGKKLMLLNAYRIELEGRYKDQILIAIEDITERRAIEQRKDDFLSIASHELKTPLTTIKGYIQLMNRLLTDGSDNKLKSAVEKTSVYVERLNNLISELLDVSRIQSGRIELHKEPFDFDEMVRDAVESILQAQDTHQIVIKGVTSCTVKGDESHISQVVTNLLSNAIKYSPDHREVEVYLSRVGNYVKAAVVDRGVGVPYADQQKIFERFYRVSDMQKQFPGMGIGLYICSEIVKNHGGSLWVESKAGKGSTFSFTLPLEAEKGAGGE